MTTLDSSSLSNEIRSHSLYYDMGVVSYKLGTYSCTDMVRAEKELSDEMFQVWLNMSLKTCIFKDDLETMKKLLNKWKVGVYGHVMGGHPFLHELMHQKGGKESEKNKNMISLVFSYKLAHDLFECGTYRDKYYHTVEERLGKCDWCLKIIKSFVNILTQS